MEKRKEFFLIPIGFWALSGFALFILFPPGASLNPFSRYLFFVLSAFFCFPVLFAMLTAHLGLAWGLVLASSLTTAFFALRFGSLEFFLPIVVFWMAGVFSHAAVTFFQRGIRRSEVALEQLETEVNLLAEKEQEETSQLLPLRRKVERYASLSELTHVLSASLVVREVTESAVQKAYELVGKSDGSLLFLTEEGEEGVSLVSSFFAEGFPGTKSKKGDVFDWWVLKRRRGLLVRDIRRDFRFNPDEMEKREIGSLIVTPLISSGRIAGLLRLEALRQEAYSSDDLRLLTIIGDLVASSVENARLAHRTEELARIDELTELYVHRYFQERLQEELVRARSTRRSLSLLMLDIDHFKTYNDRYGHIAGDLVLKQVARILKETADAGDTVCRYGGEEFCIILPERTKEEALCLAEQLRCRVEIESFVLRREAT
ncbi:MAG: diguanylate cyclase, partial [Candidatus Omnitrophota bacterium]